MVFRNRFNQNVEAVVDDAGELMIDLNLDAFNRLRVSSPQAQFDYQNEYNKGPLIWAEKVTDAGVATHQPDSSTVLMSTGGTAKDSGIIRQTIQYMRYTPGKSLLPIITWNFNGAETNVVKRAGYFDNFNGVFMELDGNVLSCVLRSKSSGILAESRVPQSAWNVAKLDGSIVKDPNLDLTKAQIGLTDIQWLGVGTVRVGFEIDGCIYVAHVYHNANQVATTYMATANLPIRYEIFNKDVVAQAGTMLQICSTVITEQGGIDDLGFYERSANNGTTATVVTTRRSVLAIRPKATFGGKINRSTIKLDDFEIITGGANVLWEIVYNPTLGGSPSWQSAGANSPVEYDIAGTTITGGEVVASGYALAGGGAAKGQAKSSTQSKYPIGLDVDGANPRLVAIVCTTLGGNASVNAALGWKEFY